MSRYQHSLPAGTTGLAAPASASIVTYRAAQTERGVGKSRRRARLGMIPCGLTQLQVGLQEFQWPSRDSVMHCQVGQEMCF
jgi:hypothetical protein